MEERKVLEVNNLTIGFRDDEGTLRQVVNRVHFDVWRGRTLGIVGESGSGKSVSAMAIMQLLPPKPHCEATGKVLFHNESGGCVDLLALNETEMRAYRGRHIAMVFQEPMTSLNPVHTCGAQVMEMLRLHEQVSAEEARKRVITLFEEVQLPRPEKIFDSYPHEISGGQKQRVMIAMALICHPDVLIADEPTTALDVTVQKTILDLLRQLQQKYGIAIIFISHDLGVISQIADDVAVLYHGDLVEQGSADEILHHPKHRYTQGLLSCRPPLEGRPRRLPTVEDFLNGKDPAPAEEAEAQTAELQEETNRTPLLSVRDLEVTYTLDRNILGKATKTLRAVDHVSFDIYRGETLGLVGESGCGKTTLGRALLRLIDSSSGSIVYDGRRLDQMSRRELRRMRPRIQIIFQDPYSSLNPRMTVGQTLMEPLRNHHIGTDDKDRQERMLELMQRVGLPEEALHRYPHEFSGGQRQRICIARALILQPELVVCDESVSALDVSVQAQVLNLLNELKEHYHYTYLFISHDLAVVHYLSDRIMVMQQGQLVEMGESDSLFNNPQKKYTRTLLDAIPRIDS